MANTTSYKIRRIRVRLRRMHVNRVLAVILVVALGVSGIATVIAMRDLGPLETDFTTVIILLNLDVILALALGVLIARRIVRNWSRRTAGGAATRLHIRLVVLFSLVAVIPAILVAVFSGLFLNYGIESWFSDRVRTAINESQAVATAYLREHQRNIRGDALAMANDLNRAAPRIRVDQRFFRQLMQTQALIRGLPEAAVVDGAGNTLMSAGLSVSLGFDVAGQDLLGKIFTQTRPGEVQILSSDSDDRVRAGIRLEAFPDAYLLVGRLVEPQVLDHLSMTRGAATQYQQLEDSREELQIRFLAVFALVALLLLLAAVWTGWTVANQLATPIGKLIDAAERIRSGDLSARVQTEGSGSPSDEIGMLSRAFNRMTEQINTQQEGLVAANRQLDERRQFTETVLGGVSAGVIGMDADGGINLPNRRASELLETDLDNALGRPLVEVVPEMAELFAGAAAAPGKPANAELTIERGGRQRTLVVSIAAERLDGKAIGFVVTFDDVTELVSAQRKAAWADIARRIAHEIKNPLTPIQLSAERLRRKYRNEVVSDPEVFTSCTETIVRQVEDIGRMVDEFSAFARMPQPDRKPQNLTELCREAVFLERNRCPEISYQAELPEEPLRLNCDRQQISRALTNVLKNAAEAIRAKFGESESASNGVISVTINDTARHVIVQIEDNGSGLPNQLIDRLAEPYVTTRSKGTGLGLAIVKKIMEDHQGDLVLQDRDEGGARISLMFGREAVADNGTNPDPDESTENTTVAHGA
ncbi:MAG: PAS domain-containing sensor histidine kinase [Rhodospirillales bacterium]|nr:PAS domain-containing sensor histidine kinase [Rhodospirillales bacterium]